LPELEIRSWTFNIKKLFNWCVN